MEHNIWIQVLSLLGSLIVGGAATAAYGKRASGGGGFLMNQGKSRISNAIGRTNTHNNNNSEAESILIETAKMSVQDRDNAHKQASEYVKMLLDANYRLGKAEAKAEILEKEKFPQTDSPANDMFLHNPLSEAADALETPNATTTSDFQEKPLEEAGNAKLEILPKSERRKHILLEHGNENAENPFDADRSGKKRGSN